MALVWEFPLNNDGIEEGLNDPGIETFLGNPLESLAREIIQNSRDAVYDADKPVEVHFTLYSLEQERFPAVDGFDRALIECANYWSSNSKATKFFANARSIVSDENINFLKISDFNTKGLGGSSLPRGSDWHRLTKAVGTSEKGGGQDGSFGIGKHAPFACSPLRTVFYSTKARDGSVAFQGVAKLVTHENKAKKTTRGTGYYGERAGLKPVCSFDGLDNFFTRTKFGTDIFVAGVDLDDDWETKVVASVIENFFVAINDGKLIVLVGDHRIDKDSLPELLAELAALGSNRSTTGFYRALVEETSHLFFEDDFQGLGRIELYVAEGDDLAKHVAMVRQSGMTVYLKKHFRTPLRFAGVFIARGQALNDLLKSLEPPSHDAWQERRHDDVLYARTVLRALNAWITDKVKELTEVTEADEVDPEGLSQYLPDDLDGDDTGKGHEESEDGPSFPKPVEIESRSAQPRATQMAKHLSTATAGDDVSEGPTEHDGENYGDDGEPPSDTTDAGLGQSGETTSPEQGKTPVPKLMKVELNSVRVFCSDYTTGEYTLAFSPETAGAGHIQLHIVGEVGEEVAQILTSRDALTGENFHIGTNGIGPIPFEVGIARKLKVTLKSNLRCALEVVAHAS